MKKIGLLLLFLLTLPLLFSQMEQTKDLELELEKGTDYSVIPLGKRGFIYTNTAVFSGGPNRKVTFTRYNTGFEEVWKKEYSFDKSIAYSDSYVTKNDLFLSFRGKLRGKYQIIKIDLTTGKEKKFEGKLLPGAGELSFKVLADHIYGVYKLRTTLYAVTINHMTGEVNQHKVAKKLGLRFGNLTIHREQETASISFFNSKKKTLNLLIFNNKGEVQREYSFADRDSRYRLNSAKLNYLNGRDKIIIGLYGEKSKGQTQGIYTAHIEGDGLDNIKYHSFNDFENFFSYLPDFLQNMVQKNKARKKSRDKELKYNFNFLEHELIVNDEGYIWVGEAFFATYRTETRTVFVNGQMVTQTYQVFDGWVFSHAVVAAFDRDGNKLWDNCFDMGDFKTFNLREYVKVNAAGNKVEMVYSIGSTIRGLKIVDGEVIVNKVYMDIANADSTLFFDRTSSIMEYWYNNYFICYGITKVKNRENKKWKKLLFINRVNYSS